MQDILKKPHKGRGSRTVYREEENSSPVLDEWGQELQESVNSDTTGDVQSISEREEHEFDADDFELDDDFEDLEHDEMGEQDEKNEKDEGQDEEIEGNEQEDGDD